MESDNVNIKSTSRKSKKEIVKFCKCLFEDHVPIFNWLPKYKWNEFFIGDLMAGLTLGCIHIPQGLACAILAHTSPIYGLYTSCFSVLVYCFFGTAVISSFGPALIASILTGEAVSDYTGSEFSNEELVSTITLLVGVYYMISYVLRFSVVTKLFTKYLISSFILACCIHIIVKSFKNVLDINIRQERGYFSFIFNIYNTSKEISQTNFVTLGVSIVVLIAFILNTYFIKPSIKKWTNFILPMEMIVLIVATALSHYLNFDEYDVSLIGKVPTGFPTPIIPNINAVPIVWMQALLISVLNFSTSLSMTMMFNKDLRPGQELFSYAVTNIICSTMNTLPFGNSIIRTVVAQSCGINSLLCSIISSVFMLMIILFLGPLFSSLPQCVLGCIIIYTLSELMISKIKEIPTIFQSGVENIIIYLVTLTVSVLLSIQLGLLCGVILTSRQYLADKPEEQMKKQMESNNGDAKNLPEQHLLLVTTEHVNKEIVCNELS